VRLSIFMNYRMKGGVRQGLRLYIFLFRMGARICALVNL
jgi:hypothetical protein